MFGVSAEAKEPKAGADVVFCCRGVKLFIFICIIFKVKSATCNATETFTVLRSLHEQGRWNR